MRIVRIFQIFIMIHFLFISTLFAQNKSFDQVDKDNEFQNCNINIDGKMLVGAYGDAMLSISMIQGMSDFTYQINSDMKYINNSNELENSGYFKNDTDFTGEININEYWKIIPELEVRNSSYGMFDNSSYSEEKRDSISLKLKNEYKPAPARWNFDLFYNRFGERLVSYGSNEETDDVIHDAEFALAMEYVWSASNKVGFNFTGGNYEYGGLDESDSYSNNELYGSFKTTEYIMLTVSPIIVWNKDKTDYIYFKGNVSTVGLKYLSFELSYEYNNRQYDPISFLNDNRFAAISYDVAPSIVHRTELKSDFELNYGGNNDNFIGLKHLSLKLMGVFESNDNFYNYETNSDDLIVIEEMPVDLFNIKSEFVTKMVILGHNIDFEIVYNYFKYIKSEDYKNINITYRPDYSCKISLIYSGSFLEAQFENDFIGSVYEKIDSSEKNESSILGALSISMKFYESFHVFSKIENLYDEEYYYREGYPEPGRKILAGLRIVI